MHIPSLRDLNRSLHISTQIEKLQAELASIFGGIVHAVIPEPKKKRRRRKAKRKSAKAAPAPVAAEKTEAAPRKKAKRKAAARKPKMKVIGRVDKAAEVRARRQEVASGNAVNTVAPVATEPKARRVSKKPRLVPTTKKAKKSRRKKA